MGNSPYIFHTLPRCVARISVIDPVVKWFPIISDLHSAIGTFNAAQFATDCCIKGGHDIIFGQKWRPEDGTLVIADTGISTVWQEGVERHARVVCEIRAKRITFSDHKRCCHNRFWFWFGSWLYYWFICRLGRWLFHFFVRHIGIVFCFINGHLFNGRFFHNIHNIGNICAFAATSGQRKQ